MSPVIHVLTLQVYTVSVVPRYVLKFVGRACRLVVHDMVILTDIDGMHVWRYHYSTGTILSSYY